MRANPSRDINERCWKLAEFGFEIHHTDSRVVRQGYAFDFSAIDITSMDKLIYHVVQTVEKRAKEVGRIEAVNCTRKSLGLSPIEIEDDI